MSTVLASRFGPAAAGATPETTEKPLDAMAKDALSAIRTQQDRLAQLFTIVRIGQEKIQKLNDEKRTLELELAETQRDGASAATQVQAAAAERLATVEQALTAVTKSDQLARTELDALLAFLDDFDKSVAAKAEALYRRLTAEEKQQLLKPDTTVRGGYKEYMRVISGMTGELTV
jgi:hypothetical protein